MYGHTDTDTVGSFHLRIRLYRVSRYAVFSYVRFWPTPQIYQRGLSGQKPKYAPFCIKGGTTHTLLHQLDPT